jgi:hypothetical protein
MSRTHTRHARRFVHFQSKPMASTMRERVGNSITGQRTPRRLVDNLRGRSGPYYRKSSALRVDDLLNHAALSAARAADHDGP